jgi:hypothetical protein
MRPKHRAVATGVAAMTSLGVVLWLGTRPKGVPPVVEAATRQVEFAPLAARSDSASPQAMTLKDVAEPTVTRPRRAVVRPQAPPKAFVVSTMSPTQPPALASIAVSEKTPVVATMGTEVRAEPAVALYVPGCVGYAKRMWAAGEAVAGEASPRRNCTRGAPREIILDPLPSGICANPERDRGLPAMCAQGKRRR